MKIVKGSKQYPLKIVEYRPIRQWLALALGGTLAVLLVYGAYIFGLQLGREGKSESQKEIARLSSALQSATDQNIEMKQKLTNMNLGLEVDKQATEDVRQEVISLKNDIAKLREENSFYRNLMAPTDNKRGLHFGVVEISDTEVSRSYSYKVVMQQLATDHTLLNGSLKISVVGRLGDQSVSYGLNQLSDQIKGESIKLRFKYFQTIEGRMQLPEGFEPERIEMSARATGKQATTIEKRFGWLVEETANAG